MEHQSVVLDYVSEVVLRNLEAGPFHIMVIKGSL